MPDPTLLADTLLKLAIAAAIAAAAAGWLALTRARALTARANAKRAIGKQRRDRSVRELKHRASRWYRWQGRLQLAATIIPIERLDEYAIICRQRGGRLWREAKELEGYDPDAYALRALPFTTRR